MKVVILMSTYNGEKYIKEQLDSLYTQTIPVSVYVRDDGSSDSTCEILKDYEKKMGLSWYSGKNLGPGKSFFELILNAPNADFYAFSDQDDVWDNDKIEIALSYLSDLSQNKPALYCSRFRPVDCCLNPINISKSDMREKDSFGRSLIEALAPGCTFVFNYKAVEEFRKFKMDYIDIHDWALYRIIMALDGNIIYDHVPHLFYRQHSDNAIGFKKRNLSFWISRLINFFYNANINERSIFAQHLNEIYNGSMDNKHKDIVKLFVDYKKSWRDKIRLICCQDVSRTQRIDTFFINFLILLGKL